MANFLFKPLLLTCVALCGAQARADGTTTFTDFVDGSTYTSISYNGQTEAGSAGGFATIRNGGASFVTYCTDLAQNLSFGPTYSDYSVADGSAHAFQNSQANVDIGRLYSENNVLSSGIGQAAFQIAIWEIAYETSGHYDVGTGNAQFAGDAAALANTWLAALPGQSSYRITVLESGVHQDVLFATAVPEPSSMALMAAGLLGLGIVSRRRKTVG